MAPTLGVARFGRAEQGVARFGCAELQAVVSLRPAVLGQAPLAQSVERFHGKEKVNGSIPLGGSKNTLEILLAG